MASARTDTQMNQWNDTVMDIGDLLAPKGIIPRLRAKTKKQALHELAARAAEVTGLEPRTIFETLCNASVWAPPGSAAASPSRT